MSRTLLALIGILLAVAMIVAVALSLWLRSDAIRQTIAAQASAAIGMPVSIGSVRAAMFPTLAVELSDVVLGDPPRARLDRVSIATALSAIWTRRIENADVELTGGYSEAEMLGALAAAGGAPPTHAAPSPLAVVSIRSISVRNVSIRSGQDRIPLSLEASLAGDRLVLSEAEAEIGGASVRMKGEMSSLARREGHFDVRSDTLPIAHVLGVFSGVMPVRSASSKAPADESTQAFKVTATVAAPVATLGASAVESFDARIEATPAGIVADPVRFGLHAGRVEARVLVDLSQTPLAARLRGRVAGLDVARLRAQDDTRADAFAGRLDATFAIQLPAQADASAVLETSRGSADVVVRDGRMPGIEVVRSAVIRFANRAEPPAMGPSSDRFSQLTASLTLQPGLIRISRLTMAAPDFDLAGDGSYVPASGQVALAVDVTLSEALSQNAGRDLYRYARDGRRIVLPAVIGGTMAAPTATIDLGKAAGRALKNRIEEETKSLIEKLIRRSP
jgi:uncharacterized protein involved in outer membrane biogenesis